MKNYRQAKIKAIIEAQIIETQEELAAALTAAGLPELVANSPREYVAKAVQLATNGIMLNKLHRDLPEMMRNSRLMDGKAYMQDLEAAYKKIWQHYCSGSLLPIK